MQKVILMEEIAAAAIVVIVALVLVVNACGVVVEVVFYSAQCISVRHERHISYEFKPLCNVLHFTCNKLSSRHTVVPAI